MRHLTQQAPDDSIVSVESHVNSNGRVLSGRHSDPATSPALCVPDGIPLRSLSPQHVQQHGSSNQQVYSVNLSNETEGSTSQATGSEALAREHPKRQSVAISDRSFLNSIVQFVTALSCVSLEYSGTATRIVFRRAFVQPSRWLWDHRPAAVNLLLALASLVLAIVGLVYVVLERRSAREALDLTKWTAWKDYKAECREEVSANSVMLGMPCYRKVFRALLTVNRSIVPTATVRDPKPSCSRRLPMCTYQTLHKNILHELLRKSGFTRYRKDRADLSYST